MPSGSVREREGDCVEGDWRGTGGGRGGGLEWRGTRAGGGLRANGPLCKSQRCTRTPFTLRRVRVNVLRAQRPL
eukprot:2467640-Prymnesium_polylepis.1